ncbi:MAG: response regulator transcription factor [Candidatus Dormibacteraceae bacterium]
MNNARDLVEPSIRRVLIIDPDAAARRELRRGCEQQAYQVSEAGDGQMALSRFQETPPSIVLLESTLPGGSGLDLCRELRRLDPRVPIIVISQQSEEIEVVVALEVGADDYVTKPIRVRELLARMAAHLRKAQSDGVGLVRGRMAFGDLQIDVNERRAQRRTGAGDGDDWQEVDLTHTEFDLLAYLAANAGRVLSRERILNTIWGYDYPIETRVIDVHVRNLRKKVEVDPSRPAHILAVPGIGYRFTNPTG